jgi:hypothetical protein
MQDSAPKSCPCLSEVWHGVPLWDDRHCTFLSTTGAGGWGICGSGWSKTVIILGKKLASVDASGGNTQKRVSRSKTTERTRGPGIWRWGWWGTGGREKKRFHNLSPSCDEKAIVFSSLLCSYQKNISKRPSIFEYSLFSLNACNIP